MNATPLHTRNTPKVISIDTHRMARQAAQRAPGLTEAELDLHNSDYGRLDPLTPTAASACSELLADAPGTAPNPRMVRRARITMAVTALLICGLLLARVALVAHH
jgi:hypothetical protein